MIEKIVITYLSAALQVPVYAEIPQKRPERFIVVDKTGSSQENRITTSMIAVQSYAESKLMAAELNEDVKSAMDALTDLDEVCCARLNSDYSYTYTASKRYRYQAVYDITHY